MLDDVWIVTAALAVTLFVATGFAVRTRQFARITTLERFAGTAILVRSGKVAELSADAEHLLALRKGKPVAQALQREFEGSGLAEALARAETTGEEAELLCHSTTGTPYLAQLGPRGALIRLVLSDVSALADTRLTQDPEPTPPRRDPVHRLLDSAPLLVWERDGKGGVLWADGRIGSDTAGVGAAEVAAMVARHPANAAPAPSLGPRSPSLAVRLDIARPDGQRIPLQISEVATEEQGRLGFAVDASGALTAERSLTQFVQTMTETFAHLTVGLAIFDRDGALALFNPALVTLWQLDPTWLARKPHLREILDNLRAGRRIPDLRDYHDWRTRLLALLDDVGSADYEELWTLGDGTTIRVLARPHPQGSLAFVFDDVTERMRLEQRNRHMDDLIHSTLDCLGEGLAVFGANGTLRYVNAAFHEIWHTDETIMAPQTHVSDFCTLARGLTVDTDIWDRIATFATGEGAREVLTARITMGSGRILGGRFAPLPDGSTMAVFADVTDSERIAAALQDRNEALEAAEQMRAAVLDQISHRLRTPLNTVFGFGELLQNPRFGTLNERQESYVSGVLEAASQLLDTVSEVTELASLQIDPQEGEEPGQSVEDVLAMTVSLLEKRAIENRIHLVLDLQGSVGLLDIAPARLRQIVFNLAADAIHRCGRGGEVRLIARRIDTLVEILTSETVTPQPGSEQPRIEIRSPTFFLVRRIVAEEGGVLQVDVANEDNGGDTSERLRVVCRFPEPLAPTVPA
ncbi:MAG: PAS-domain containing protein, partial [Pseudomonadota bacterium]